MVESDEDEYHFILIQQLIWSLHQETSLHEAAKEGNLEQVKHLVDNEADTDTRDTIGVSSYIYDTIIIKCRLVLLI